MMLKIEKGIPIPAPTGLSHELGQFEIGDSAFIEVAKGKKTSTFCAMVYNYAARSGKEFKTRTATENGVRGVRIWRVA